MRALGAGYIKTIVYWPHEMPFFGKAILTLLMDFGSAAFLLKPFPADRLSEAIRKAIGLKLN